MSKFTTYLQNEIVNIKAELADSNGDSFVENMFSEQLASFELSLVKSIEADALFKRSSAELKAGNYDLSEELHQTALSLIKP